MPETNSSSQPSSARSQATSKPGEGGWTPRQIVPIVGACLAGGLTATGAALQEGEFTLSRLLGIFAVGCGTSVAAYLGIKSAGPRRIGK